LKQISSSKVEGAYEAQNKFAEEIGFEGSLLINNKQILPLLKEEVKQKLNLL
jgi:hypothetical protein